MEILNNIGGFLHYGLSFIIIISLIVFIHEWGHFIVARMCGVRIDEFSIGFGKELWGRTDKKGTRWKICLIPMGGFVKMHGDASEASTPDRDKLEHMGEEEKKISFHFKPLWQKTAIVAAGPAINYLLAIAIFFGLYTTYGEFTVNLPPVVGAVREGYPAAEAGIKKGDVITKINGSEVKTFNDIVKKISITANEEVSIELLREGKPLTLTLTTKVDHEKDQFGNKAMVGRIGIESVQDASLDSKKSKPYGVLESMGKAVGEVYHRSEAMLKGLWQIITGQRSVKELGGPVKIMEYSGHNTRGISDGISCYTQGREVYLKSVMEGKKLSEKQIEAISKVTCEDVMKEGIIISLVFMATISTMLGLTNLLPIPMLDGGHIMFYLVEAIFRKPVGEKYQEWAFRAGFAFLIGLTLYVTFNDIMSVLQRYVLS